MIMNKLLVTAFILAAGTPILAHAEEKANIDTELNQLGFTQEQYRFDKNSNNALTTFFIKDNSNNANLDIYLYDASSTFKYDPNITYSVSYNYLNNQESFGPLDWTIHSTSLNKKNLVYQGSTINGTVTKWTLKDYASEHDVNKYRVFKLNNFYSNNYAYVLEDHFVINPIDENGKCDIHYTQNNVVTLSNINVYGYAIDEYNLSFWDKYFTGHFKKGLYYFYSFDVSNYNIDELYVLDMQYQIYDNAEVYIGSKYDSGITAIPDFNTYENRYIKSLGNISNTITKTLSSTNVKDTSDVVDYRHYKYSFNEIDKVKNILANSTEDANFNSFVTEHFGSNQFICNFVNYDVDCQKLDLNKYDYGMTNDWKKNYCITETSKESFGTSIFYVQHYQGFKISTPEIRNINVLRMKFMTNGNIQDVPVKAKVTEEVSGIGDSPENTKLGQLMEIIRAIVNGLKSAVAWICIYYGIILAVAVCIIIVIVVIQIIRKVS